MKIRLLTSYLSMKEGTIYDEDASKSSQLVSMGRAEYIEEPKKVEKESERKKRGRRKDMQAGAPMTYQTK